MVTLCYYNTYANYKLNKALHYWLKIIAKLVSSCVGYRKSVTIITIN